MKPYMITVTGLPGVGKIFVSKQLTKILDTVYLDEDRIKHKLLPELLGKEKYEWYIKHQKLFSPDIRLKMYEDLYSEIEDRLKLRKNVIVDGVFYLQRFRQDLYDIANSCNVDFYLVEVICPEEIVKERMNKRFKEENATARFGIYREIKKVWEPIKEEHIIIDSGEDIDKQIKHFFKEQFHTASQFL